MISNRDISILAGALLFLALLIYSAAWAKQYDCHVEKCMCYPSFQMDPPDRCERTTKNPVWCR